MLGLSLREEFHGRRLKGTAIELANEGKTGATQIAAEEFLEFTYPTRDLVKGIEAIGPDRGRPVVVMGERGLGKSHLLGAFYHAVNDAASTRKWLQSWADKLGDPKVGKIELRDQMLVIGESLHRQRYKFLWDILFKNHPHGAHVAGMWDGQGPNKTDVPSDELITTLLEHTPTMLLLDEFQTWFDGLTDTKRDPWKKWAYNFIQILSDIAKERPELLVLVISVRNGSSDAYRQVHRANPVTIDFKAGNAARVQQDRRRMLLHRLFRNRSNVSAASVSRLVATHVDEYCRLLDVPSSEKNRKAREFVECWPYAPHLLRLLEEQVLVATDAQETRDMIRILANLYKSQGGQTLILTAANFRLDDDQSGIGALLDSVANTHHRSLRSKAQQNIISVTEAVPECARLAPHMEEIVGALWLRSIAVGNLAGAEPTALQADITRDEPIDDNAFQVELATIMENSFNLHQTGGRLIFREEENPQARLIACARNDKIFSDDSDLDQLAKEIRYVIAGTEDVAKTHRVIALPKSWQSAPWPSRDEVEHPDRWDDRLPILVLPEDVDNLSKSLGLWLKDHLQKHRNTIRFLLPRSGSSNVFQDRDLLILSRAVVKAQEWSGQESAYKPLLNKYQRELRDGLKQRFNRFAVLHRWDYVNPSQCIFDVENLTKQGADIPAAIEESLVNDLFEPEDFRDFVLDAASRNESLGKLLKELREPRPAGEDCIPWLGEVAMKDRILRLCALGRIAINARGMEYLQAKPGEDEDTEWKRLRSKLPYTGRLLDEVRLLHPSAVPTTGGTGQAVQPQLQPGSVAGGGDKPQSPLAPAGETGTPPGGLFDDDDDTSGRPRERLNNPSTSPLNLIGKIEGWGIGPATKVAEVSIKTPAATGAQLKELIKKLPDGMTFELSLEKEAN